MCGLRRSAMKTPPVIKRYFVTVVALVALQATAQGAEPDTDAVVVEFRKLIAINPKERTEEQTQRLRLLWRTTESIKTRGAWFEMLQPGDSVLTFPGLIVGKRISYDAVAREYTIHGIDPSRVHEEDTWSRAVVVSEDWIVLRKRELKMNSR